MPQQWALECLEIFLCIGGSAKIHLFLLNTTEATHPSLSRPPVKRNGREGHLGEAVRGIKRTGNGSYIGRSRQASVNRPVMPSYLKVKSRAASC